MTVKISDNFYINFEQMKLIVVSVGALDIEVIEDEIFIHNFTNYPSTIMNICEIFHSKTVQKIYEEWHSFCFEREILNNKEEINEGI